MAAAFRIIARPMSSSPRTRRSLPVVQAEPWYAEGLSFTCTQCGNCCTGGPGYVWISQEEINRLAAHLEITVHEVLAHYCRRLSGGYSLKEVRTPANKYDCVFLRTTKVGKGKSAKVVRTCQIYRVRPLQCRTWPFWDGLLSSRENWDRASESCPGMNKGKRYTREQIEALRDAKDWPDAPPGSDR